VLYSAEHVAKVKQIAQERGVSEHDAACMYVMGSLKASVRNGSAPSIIDALERYEDAQVGDRAVSVRGESSTALEVRRIDKANQTKLGSGTTHRRNMGKVLGTLYVEWDESEEQSAIDVVLEREGYDAAVLAMDSAIQAYIDEYVTRLSVTARASISMLVKSAYSIEVIMKGKDVETAKLKERVKYLHHNFPRSGDVTARELLTLLRKYAA
jgi:hypothetical protein